MFLIHKCLGGYYMNLISLEDLLGCSVKKLSSGSELMFVYELSKYTKMLLNKTLDLKDIQVVKELFGSEYMAYLQNKGVHLCVGAVDSTRDLSEIERKFFNDDLSGIVFESQTDEEWVYSYTTNKTANLVLNRYNRSAGYVSLYAYMVVKFYADGKKCPVLRLKNTSPKQEELEYVDILILKNFGNCFLKNKVVIEYSRDVVNQPEWEAYVMYQRQLGYMLSESTPAEKYKYTVKNYNVGDVVLFYKTEKSIRSKTIRRLTNCFPAVIRSITKSGIIIEYYPDITTRLTHQRELEEAERLCGGEIHYNFEDYRRFSSCSISLNFYNLGVDLLLYLEDEFILRPQNGVDTFKQYLRNKDGIEGVYKLGTLDTIYAVFEDRKIHYNKEKFLELYFKKEVPVYEQVVNGSKK